MDRRMGTAVLEWRAGWITPAEHPVFLYPELSVVSGDGATSFKCSFNSRTAPLQPAVKYTFLIASLCLRLAGQAPSTESELVEMQTVMATQRDRLRDQRERIQNLKTELAETEKLLNAWLASKQ